MRAARFSAGARASSGSHESGHLAPPASDVRPGPTPTFSVIVAAYNVADVIGDALESVRSQTHAPLELIVCDDGSTDELERALEAYRGEIQLLRKENGGEASAKNAAAAAAKGDFVVILDADDVYFPDRIEALCALARERPDLDILTTDGLLVAGERVVRHVYDRTWSFEVADQRRAILQRNFIFGLTAVRRELLLEHDGFDESILWTTDWDLWLRLILAGARAGCVDRPLALYRLRETSLTAHRRELLLGKLSTLEKARGNPDLLDAERPVLEDSLAAYTRELALMDLRLAVAAGAPGVRSQALGLLRTRGYTPRVRLELAAMGAAPRMLGQMLRRQAASSWVGAAGIRVRRRTDGEGSSRPADARGRG